MPEFKTKEEYQRWKTQKVNEQRRQAPHNVEERDEHPELPIIKNDRRGLVLIGWILISLGSLIEINNGLF